MGRGSGGSHREKKGVAGSPGLVDFANGLVNSVVKLREVFGGKFKLQKNCHQFCSSKKKFNDSWVSTC